ncbi:MAG: hypothetical protein AB7Q16_15795 [Vicinamibacterales bacterium]
MTMPPAALAFVALVAATLSAWGNGPSLEAIVRDITVFDARSGEWRTHQDILIEGTRVQAVRPHATASPDAKYVVEGSGKFAIPGLFEHPPTGAVLTEVGGSLLARGVTSIWAGGWGRPDAERWQRGLDRGEHYGPRLVGVGQPAPGRGRGDANVLATLIRLIEAEGLTSGAALREVTLREAERAGRAADLGSIDTGKVADLLILSGSPATDIRNVAGIDAVIFRGEVLTRAHLNLLRQGRLKPGDGQLRRGQR